MTSLSTETVPQWQRLEHTFLSASDYANPLHDVALRITFTAPSGTTRVIDGFWDGGRTWRARFAPDEQGEWSYRTDCSDAANSGLHNQAGRFTCGAPTGTHTFGQHGPIRVADNHRFLMHADGTPWLWLSDTAWNGPLRATETEWQHYLDERVRQGFTAVQWVATQWLASPHGDRDDQPAYTGTARIAVNPTFFQRLDRMHDAITAAGLVSAPVLLWAAEWSNSEVNLQNPGVTLPDDDAIALARYMVARWGAQPVVWIINGDGSYTGAKAERWLRIGHAVFGERPHAPVSLHPGGMSLPTAEFRAAAWLDITGYQSGHGDDAATMRWLVEGPPTADWRLDPPRPSINLEPPYEDHIAYQSGGRLSAALVRRALYWSLLIAPTAGVSYGGHGVWGWDDGSGPPVAHPNTGTPKPWQEALHLPAAEQIRYLANCFASFDWWRLQPAPELLAVQPGETDPQQFIAVASSEANDLVVAYTPAANKIALKLAVAADANAKWFHPTTGEQTFASFTTAADQTIWTPPSAGDWVLIVAKI